MRRPVAAAAALVLAIAALVGCAPSPDPLWTPQPGPAAVVVDAATGTIDPASVPGATGQRLRSADPNVAARWTSLPGRAPVNDRLQAEVRSAIDAFAAATGAHPYAPVAQPVGAGFADRGCVPGSSVLPAGELLTDPRFAAARAETPALAITCDVVLAAGSIFGERLRIVEGLAAAVSSDRTVTIVSDTATGETASVAELLVPTLEADAALWRAAVEAARHASGALWPAEISLPAPELLAAFRASLTGVSLDQGGGIVATAPGGIDAPELDGLAARAAATGRIDFRLAPEVAATLLTDLGRRAVAAGSTGAAYAGPAAVPAGLEAPDCTLIACVALTYDDGPDADLADLLAHLREGGAAATFFVIGGKVAASADALRQVVAEGHEVGNHSQTHLNFAQVPARPPQPSTTPGPTGTVPPSAPASPAVPDPHADVAQMSNEISMCSAAVSATAGVTPTLFRPPYGAYDDRLFAATSMPVVLWDVDTNDWRDPGVPALVDAAVSASNAGSIVLMHSTHRGSIDATPAILDGFADRGLRVVTVTQLFGGNVPSGAVRHA